MCPDSQSQTSKRKTGNAASDESGASAERSRSVAEAYGDQVLLKCQNLLNEVESIGKIGGWEMDMITRTARWTMGTYDIVEIDPGQPIPGPDEHLDYYLPEYRPVVAQAMQALVESGTPLDFEAKGRTAKGRVIWVRALGRAVRENGRCTRIYGTLQDITDRKHVPASIWQASSSSPCRTSKR